LTKSLLRKQTGIIFGIDFVFFLTSTKKRIMRIYFLTILFIAGWQLVLAQDDKKVFEVGEEGRDTLPQVYLKTVNIHSKTFDDPRKQAEFDKLRDNVIEVYPYAMIARELYYKIQNDLDGMNRWLKRKRYVRQKEDSLKDRFKKELKNLSRTEGQILVKIINRETGNNCYKLIEQLKNPFSAFFWQNFGRLYGYDLKEEYEPNGKHKDIEYIVQSLQESEIEYYKSGDKPSIDTLVAE